MLSLSNLAAFTFALSQRGVTDFFRRQFLDQTFKGLYTANGFDMLLLIPYFIVLIFLASYGIHRYVLVYLYYKHKKNAAWSDQPPGRYSDADLPTIVVQLPIFNEQFVIDRLVDACSHMQYPQDKILIQVLDDSTDETVKVASEVVDRY